MVQSIKSHRKSKPIIKAMRPNLPVQPQTIICLVVQPPSQKNDISFLTLENQHGTSTRFLGKGKTSTKHQFWGSMLSEVYLEKKSAQLVCRVLPCLLAARALLKEEVKFKEFIHIWHFTMSWRWLYQMTWLIYFLNRHSCEFFTMWRKGAWVFCLCGMRLGM